MTIVSAAGGGGDIVSVFDGEEGLSVFGEGGLSVFVTSGMLSGRSGPKASGPSL